MKWTALALMLVGCGGARVNDPALADMARTPTSATVDLATAGNMTGGADLAPRSQPWDTWYCYMNQCAVFADPLCDHEYNVGGGRACYMDWLLPPGGDLAGVTNGVLVFTTGAPCWTGDNQPVWQQVCAAELDDACVCDDGGCAGRLTRNPCTP